MPPRKNRPVLYEVVQQGRRSREPRWRRPEPPAAQTPEPARSDAIPAPPPPVRDGEPGIAFADGKLRLALGWPALVITGIGALFILWVAFQAGTRYARTMPLDDATLADIEETSQDGELADADAGERDVVTPTEQPRPPQPRPREVTETPPPAPPEPEFSFQPGYHYIVAQHFPKRHEQTAIDAGAWLIEHGIDVVVLPRTRDVELVATRGFNLEQKDRRAQREAEREADALMKKIRDLGKEFARQQAVAGKPQYSLDQPYKRKVAEQ